MIYLISLNEITLFRFLVLIAFGKNVKVLRIAPFMLMTRGFFTRLVNWGIREEKTEYAVKLTPELQHHWDFERRFYFQEIFKKYEPWQDQYYGFHSPHVETDESYGYSFKKITCSYTFWKVIEIYVLDAITKKIAAGEYRVYGLMPDTKELGRYLLGPEFAGNIRAMGWPRLIVNSTFILVSCVYTLAWLLSRTRPTVRRSEVALMFDIMKDGREYELFKEIADAGKFVLIDRFPNSPGLKPIPAELDAIIVKRTDGLFSIISALKSLKLAIVDVLKNGHRYWDAPPALFFEMLSMPYKRLLIRGMLNRYHPKAFIGRDEYNVDHVMRRIELEEKGIKSIGLSNALFPCFSSLAPNARYVSYDTYYLYAAPLFEQYRDTWASDMKTKTLGGYSLPREKMQSNIGSKGENILFTMRVAWNRPEMVRMVRGVAEAFPDRTIYLQFKKGFVSEEHTRRLIKECGEGVPNFVFTTDDVYGLLNTAKYHISDISTFVAEAIRSGMVTLVADILEMEFNCYRQFPDLCSKTAEDLVGKLIALENGDATYPHDTYFKLLGYKANDVGYDILRKDLNLTSKTPVNQKHIEKTL
jgi:hypothetical protein